ncbi:MAG: TonB-dependent receptor plug domain-containing protein, partial [Ferruginibacter sp.]
MKLRLYLIFICILVYVASFSQTVSGRVKYPDGHPVENASIRILNTEKNAQSDQDGNFSIQLAAGDYRLAVTAAACDTVFRKVNVSFSSTTIAIVLTTKGRELDEVVVSATKTAIGKRYTPMNITVVDRQQIENSSESALLPVLAEQVPGLFVTERGITGFGVSAGSAGAVSMRGISGNPNNRILVLINGSPQFMGLFGHPLPDAYVASDVEKVEVIHGAGSVLYGTNAMAGVINILTRTQQQDGYSVNARVLYGSFNTQKYLANIGYRKKGFSVIASVNKDHTDGHRAASAFNITNGYIKFSNRFSEHLQIALETNLAKFNAEDPGPVTGQKGPSVDVFRGSTYLNIANTNNYISGNFQLFYNYGKHAITDGFRSRDANYGFSLYQSFK